MSATSSTFTSLTLSWNASNDANEYILYRSTNANTNFTQVYKGTATSHTDNELLYATTYYYTVSAVNDNGESAQSNAVSGATDIPQGFDVSGSTSPNVNYPFSYVDDFNGKPRYQSNPTGLLIIVPSSGDFEGLWTIYDQIESMVLYYYPDVTDYPLPTGWLYFLDDSTTSILLTPTG